MRTRGRRRLDVAVIAFGSLVGTAATAIGGAISDRERHGIVRRIPGLTGRDAGERRVP